MVDGKKPKWVILFGSFVWAQSPIDRSKRVAKKVDEERTADNSATLFTPVQVCSVPLARKRSLFIWFTSEIDGTLVLLPFTNTYRDGKKGM